MKAMKLLNGMRRGVGKQGQRLHKISVRQNNLEGNGAVLLKLMNKPYKSAFDPFYAMHTKNITREQQAAFRQVWEEDIGNFKRFLNDEEKKLFQKKVDETASIDDFEALLKGLWGPERHAYIRKTNTFAYTRDTINNWIKTSSNSHESATSLIFGDDETFDNFVTTSNLKTNDKDELLREFSYGDLRYMCACIAIDYCGGPPITLVFGNRRRYHYQYPDAIQSSAYWMDCIYDRVHTTARVYVSGIHAFKDKKPISQQYFKEHLESQKHNAFKEEWRETVNTLLTKDESIFLDNFDRAFNEFQTDAGVTPLRTVYGTDWARFKNASVVPYDNHDLWVGFDGKVTEDDPFASHH